MAKLNRRAKYNRIRLFDVILSTVMILFMACIILPFLHMIAVSFSSPGYVGTGQVTFWPKGFTMETYKSVLAGRSYLKAYKNTIFVTVAGTAISLIMTAMGAYALSRRAILGHKLFSLLITFTMFFGGGMIPTYLAVADYGLTDTLWSMILPSAISTWNLIIMRSFFTAYPKEILESGYMDGLQDSGVFFRLVLPTSKAALATIGLYYAVAYWNSYMSARMYIRNTDLYPVQHYLQKMLANLTAEDTESENIVLVSASVRYASIMVAVLPIMCVYPFIQKYFVKGVMVGSIKG